MSPGTERGTVYSPTEDTAFEHGGEPTRQEVTREETKMEGDYKGEGSTEIACAGDCDRDTVDGESGFDVAENCMDTQRGPQPPFLGVEGDQNTGKRVPLVENDRNAPDGANALREACDLGSAGVGEHVTELVTADIMAEPTSTREVALKHNVGLKIGRIACLGLAFRTCAKLATRSVT